MGPWGSQIPVWNPAWLILLLLKSSFPSPAFSQSPELHSFLYLNDTSDCLVSPIIFPYKIFKCSVPLSQFPICVCQEAAVLCSHLQECSWVCCSDNYSAPVGHHPMTHTHTPAEGDIKKLKIISTSSYFYLKKGHICDRVKRKVAVIYQDSTSRSTAQN